jgi:hypothetical protein
MCEHSVAPRLLSLELLPVRWARVGRSPLAAHLDREVRHGGNLQ